MQVDYSIFNSKPSAITNMPVPSPPFQLTTCVACLLFGLAGAGVNAEESPDQMARYELGRGLKLGDTGAWLGGYTSARVEDLHQTPSRVQLSDFSLFLGWQRGRWNFFSEFEIGDGLEMSAGHGLTTGHGYFDLERLYLDYTVEDALKLRGGKFLTPIGRWNQIHADPLVWTTGSPMVVEGPFPMHIIGGMIHGNFNAWDKLWQYFVFASGSDQLDFKPDDESRDVSFRDTTGFRLCQETPGQVQFGLSYAHYTDIKLHPGEKNLLGLDFLWAHKHYELSGEFVYRFGGGGPPSSYDETSGTRNLWGLFVQGVVPLPADVYAVARYETFQREGAREPGHLFLTGLAFRPLPPLVLKAEYRFGINTGDVPPSKILGGFSEGFAASIAVLF